VLTGGAWVVGLWECAVLGAWDKPDTDIGFGFGFEFEFDSVAVGYVNAVGGVGLAGGSHRSTSP